MMPPVTLSLPFVSRLLDLSFQSKSLKPTNSIHAHLLRTGLFFDDFNLQTKLLLSYASAIFPANFLPITNLLVSFPYDDPCQWNNVLSALVRRGFPSFAIRTFSLMNTNGRCSNTYALCSALSASASLKAVGFGKLIHAHVQKSGFISTSVFVGGAMVGFYSKIGLIDDARVMFDEIPVKNTVCLNALMAGYFNKKLWDKGLGLVRLMHSLGLESDGFTLSTILRMCAEVPSARLGMQAHSYLLRSVLRLELDVFVQSCLVEMYGRCGLVPKARLVFDMAMGLKRDVVLWTSMLNAYSRNGLFDNVIATFEEMLAKGNRPDEIAFVAVIAACSRMGHVARGLGYFESMRRDYGIVPWSEHNSCVMDLLCRAGELDRAWKFANEVGMSSSNIAVSSSLWGALLSACKDCGNVEMGRVAAQRALELDPGNVRIYIELSNLYAAVDMWDEIDKLRELIKGKGMKKDAGCSWLEVTSSN